MLQKELSFERVIVPVAILLCTLYAATRLGAIFPLIPESAFGWHDYDLDQYLQDYPGGLLGMIPVIQCSASANCPPVDPRVVGVLDDPMLSTGFAFAFFGLWLSLRLDPLYRSLRDQLHRDGVVGWTPDDDTLIETRRRVWSRSVAILVFVMMVSGFLIFHFRGLPPSSAAWEFFLSACLLGAIAGHRLGASAAYGTVGHRINRLSPQVALVVGHADGAGGARRLGEFLAFQGILISIPIIWLTFWLTLEFQVEAFRAHYGQWRVLHASLLIVALVLSWYGFIRPLQIFTSHYRAAKKRLMDDWQKKTSGLLKDLQKQYYATPDWQKARDAIDDAEGITEISSKISALSSVPLRSSVRSVFSAATLFPIATLVIEILVPKQSALAKILSSGLGLFSRLLGQ